MSTIELWMDKTGQFPPKKSGEAAYWGSQLEHLVRAEFTKRTGIAVVEIAAILQSEEYPHMLANVDGICQCPTHGRCIFEAKTASAWKAQEWDNGVPKEYLLQVQHYMAVTGYKGAYIAVLIGGNQFKYQYIPCDEQIISTLIRLESAFWEHVEYGVPPTTDGTQAFTNWIEKQFPHSEPSSRIILPENTIDLIRQFEEASHLEERYAKHKRKAKNELKQMIGQNEIGFIGDHGVVRWGNVKSRKFDIKAFQIEQPDLYEQYLRDSSYRRFTIKVAQEGDNSINDESCALDDGNDDKVAA